MEEENRFEKAEQSYKQKRNYSKIVLGTIALIAVMYYAYTNLYQNKAIYSLIKMPKVKTVPKTVTKETKHHAVQKPTVQQTKKQTKVQKEARELECPAPLPDISISLNNSFKKKIMLVDFAKNDKSSKRKHVATQKVQPKPNQDVKSKPKQDSKQQPKQGNVKPKPKQDVKPKESSKINLPPKKQSKAKTSPKKDGWKHQSPIEIKKEKLDDQTTIATMIEDYYFNKSYSKAMSVSKMYLRIKQYKKAIKWALEANKLDSADEESWIIFAKANMSLGNKDAARKALRAYLSDRDSLKVKQLYEKIRY